MKKLNSLFKKNNKENDDPIIMEATTIEDEVFNIAIQLQKNW